MGPRFHHLLILLPWNTHILLPFPHACCLARFISPLRSTKVAPARASHLPSSGFHHPLFPLVLTPSVCLLVMACLTYKTTAASRVGTTLAHYWIPGPSASSSVSTPYGLISPFCEQENLGNHSTILMISDKGQQRVEKVKGQGRKPNSSWPHLIASQQISCAVEVEFSACECTS